MSSRICSKPRKIYLFSNSSTRLQPRGHHHTVIVYLDPEVIYKHIFVASCWQRGAMRSCRTLTVSLQCSLGPTLNEGRIGHWRPQEFEGGEDKEKEGRWSFGIGWGREWSGGETGVTVLRECQMSTSRGRIRAMLVGKR